MLVCSSSKQSSANQRGISKYAAPYNGCTVADGSSKDITQCRANQHFVLISALATQMFKPHTAALPLLFQAEIRRAPSENPLTHFPYFSPESGAAKLEPCAVQHIVN